MAGKFPVRCDQGSTLSLRFGVADPVATVRAVTDEDNPTITTWVPHGLSVGDEVVIVGVSGALGVNNSSAKPTWTVATVPTTTTFTVARSAPGKYRRGGTVSRPRSLAGWSARMQVRANVDSATVLVNASTATGEISLVAPAGSAVVHVVAVAVPDEVTATLTPTERTDPHAYDVEIVSPGGIVERIVQGPFTVDPEVTR